MDNSNAIKTLRILFVIVLVGLVAYGAELERHPQICSLNHHGILEQVPLKFYKHKLGVYDVNLKNTLMATQNSHLENNTYPYFKKTWLGSCPMADKMGGGRNSCIEYTVYPNKQQFLNVKYPKLNIQNQIQKYSRYPNRGMVRIITNQARTKFVYTINHEASFCGPFSVKEFL